MSPPPNNMQAAPRNASPSTAAFEAGAARIERMLDEAEASVAALDGESLAQGSRRFELPDFDDAPKAPHALRRTSASHGQLHVEIELGRASIERVDVAALCDESVIVLDQASDAPVEMRVNGKLVARGEVLVINDRFCVRVTELAGDMSSGGDDA